MPAFSSSARGSNRHAWTATGLFLTAALAAGSGSGSPAGSKAARQPRSEMPRSEPVTRRDGSFGGDSLPAAAPEPATAAAGEAEPSPRRDAEYHVRPGDVLRITVWKEPDLSSDAMVRSDGKITVPLLGDVIAARRTPRELGAELGSGFGRFVEEPQVTVAIVQTQSARFFIVGQVEHAGDYPLSGQISVLQAIALAGGFTPFARGSQVRVFRGELGTEGVTVVDFDKLARGDVRQNVVINPGDTIFVP
jgi:polysaccharide export outer membrane protein